MIDMILERGIELYHRSPGKLDPEALEPRRSDYLSSLTDKDLIR